MNEKRFVKFEILSFEDTQGCIQYFDVVREPKFEKTGIYIFITHVLVFFHHFVEHFYIKSLTGDAIKALDKETFEVVLEEPKPCRWRDPGKYFRWSGEMLINDEGNFLTLELSDLHQKFPRIVEADLWDHKYEITYLLLHPYKDDFYKESLCTHKKGCWVYRYEPGEFILDLGEATQVDGIELQNLGPLMTDRHAKEIKVFLSDSEDGPWEEIISEVLPDTRNDKEDLPILHFATRGQTLGQYLKCQILSNYGTYGGLHYFGLYTGDVLHI